MDDPVILLGTGATALGRAVCDDLSTRLCRKIQPAKARIGWFNDGHPRVEIGESVRDQRVVIIASICNAESERRVRSPSDHLMQLLCMADAAKRSSATSVSLVLPFLDGRQDRRVGGDSHRAPVTARVIADCIELLGPRQIVVVEPHVPQMAGFFRSPTEDLHLFDIFLGPVAAAIGTDEAVIIAPDRGGFPRASTFAQKLGTAMGRMFKIVSIHKARPTSGQSEIVKIEGEEFVPNRVAVVVDDMFDTSGTLVNAAIALREKGASRVIAVGIHGVFSGPAAERLAGDAVDRVIITDTIPLPVGMQALVKITVVSCAHALAEALLRFRVLA